MSHDDVNEGRMPRNVKAALDFIPRRMELADDRRRVMTVRATDAVPEGLGAGDVLVAYFLNDWAKSTVMLRTVKLVEARKRTGCGLVFAGIHRRNVPKELGDEVELFVN